MSALSLIHRIVDFFVARGVPRDELINLIDENDARTFVNLSTYLEDKIELMKGLTKEDKKELVLMFYEVTKELALHMVKQIREAQRKTEIEQNPSVH